MEDSKRFDSQPIPNGSHGEAGDDGIRSGSFEACKNNSASTRPHPLTSHLMEQVCDRDNVWKLAGSSKGWWRMSGTLQAHLAMNVRWFEELGLVSLSSRWQMLQTEGNRRCAEQACPVV